MDAIKEAHAAVFSDEDPATWLLVGSEKGKPVLRARGTGGLAEATAGFSDEQVLFAWVRLARTDDCGDSHRTKFVLLSWLGETAPPMAKAKLTEHKAALQAAFQGTHVCFSVLERAALATLAADVDDALARAGGANYDLGNTRAGVQGGHSGALKSASKQFFMLKDAETQIKGIQFEKHTRTGKGLSACDLGSRAMTASATEARRNTVGYAGGAAAAAPAGAAAAAPGAAAAGRGGGAAGTAVR